MAQREQEIGLSADELLLLIDRVRDSDAGTAEQPLSSVYPLLLKLGGAVVDLFGDDVTVKPTGSVAARFTEPELWLLRSKVLTTDGTQQDRLLGLRLTIKLMRGLLACDAPEMPDAASEAVDMAITQAQREALKRLAAEGEGNARAGC